MEVVLKSSLKGGISQSRGGAGAWILNRWGERFFFLGGGVQDSHLPHGECRWGVQRWGVRAYVSILPVRPGGEPGFEEA